MQVPGFTHSMKYGLATPLNLLGHYAAVIRVLTKADMSTDASASVGQCKTRLERETHGVLDCWCWRETDIHRHPRRGCTTLTKHKQAVRPMAPAHTPARWSHTLLKLSAFHASCIGAVQKQPPDPVQHTVCMSTACTLCKLCKVAHGATN